MPQVARGAVGKPPGPGVDRECPFCKEAMRRDATVSPPCRRESPAWEYREGRWWTASDEGQDVWYDEVGGKWQTADELPVAAVTYRVALVKLGDPRPSGRLIR